MLIPESLLRLMSPADRRAYGKAGWTAEECQQRVDNRLEGKLHAEFCGFLRRHEFDLVVHADTRGRSQLPPGWPDFSIYKAAKVLFIEFKVNRNTLSDVQKLRIARLLEEGFTVKVLRDLTDAMKITLEYFDL
jgi:hypothetical protein